MTTANQKVSVSVILVTLTLLVFWGCFPKRIGPAGLEGKRLTWTEMSVDQRKAHMKSVVLPRAAELFQTWHPERFAMVDCSLCHGQGPKNGNFQMPTSHLPRLSGELLLGPEFEKYPDAAQLKLDRLVPLMAEALGKKPFSIITRRGFGFYSCHLGPSGPMFGN